MNSFFGKGILVVSAFLFSLSAASCGGSGSDDPVKTTPTPSTPSTPETPTTPTEPEKTDTSSFAKGADVSWLTEMEHDGKKFYTSDGKEMECMSLLQSIGMNAIRLRVWVNPEGGYCDKADVVTKAERAQKLGMRIMIDFHYSDTWADPSSQTVPAAWKDYTFEQMKQAVADHTKDVLTALKEKSVDVEWVQVGNETRDGMLWGTKSGDNWVESTSVTGRASKNAHNYAAYELAGYDAVKSVYPKAKVVVHIDKGNDYDGLKWIFDNLKNNGGKWDVIGVSLYPDDATWQTQVDNCLANITKLNKEYGSKVVIAEVGTEWDSANASSILNKVVSGAKNLSTCEGVFYWEPEVYNYWKPAIYYTWNWNAYTKGAFDKSGKPTSALTSAFK